MEIQKFYQSIQLRANEGAKSLAVLIDPDNFEISRTAEFLRNVPVETTHIFVGGSTVKPGQVNSLLEEIKLYTSRPLFIFPGDVSQISSIADAILFLSLVSGRNTEYLIEQHIEAVPKLKGTTLEVIPTAYILIDGGIESAVERISSTAPISQGDVQLIVDTARAAELLGMRLVYLEAGSGALNPVSQEIIEAVKSEIEVPLVVGGGIRDQHQKDMAYEAGADMIVMGTVFENSFSK